MDELLLFVTYRPAWVGRDGFPLSWQHYVYGVRHIAREGMRQQLWMAQAMRMSSTGKMDWETYQRDINRMTEVPRHG